MARTSGWDLSSSAASPGTAATASARSRCRATAARLGSPRRWARISAASPSAPQLRFCTQGPRQTNRDGARHQQDRPNPNGPADPQSGRLPPQRRSQRHVQRGLREVAMRALIIALAAAAIALPAVAQEKPVELKKAPGLDKVEGNCSGCHSLDYIVMNSPFPNA